MNLSQLIRKNRSATVGIAVLVLGLFFTVLVSQERQDQRSQAAPSAELTTDRTNLSFTGNGYTSTYHLYAAGLDWNKPVGMILYTDGSGEYGLKNPTNSYLLGGSNGLVAVAKKHNMILLTPLSPNKACSDGDGSCWYLGDPPGYTKWAEALVASVQSQYPIDKRRVAVGGYSSGAQFSTEYWAPSGAADRTMDDGVIVAISYGGSPKVSPVTLSDKLKANVHMNWNTGGADPAYTSGGEYGVKGGYDYYTNAGFQTSLDVIAGKGHGRSGEFGPVMDAMITKHVPSADSLPPVGGGTQAPVQTSQAPVPTGSSAISPIPSSVAPTQITPSFFCAGPASCIPSTSPVPTLFGTTQTPANPTSVPVTNAVPTSANGNGNQGPISEPNQPNEPAPGGGKKEKKHKKHRKNGESQGLFKKLLEFLIQLLGMIESLLR